MWEGCVGWLAGWREGGSRNPLWDMRWLWHGLLGILTTVRVRTAVSTPNKPCSDLMHYSGFLLSSSSSVSSLCVVITAHPPSCHRSNVLRTGTSGRAGRRRDPGKGSTGGVRHGGLRRVGFADGWSVRSAAAVQRPQNRPQGFAFSRSCFAGLISK